MARTKQTVRKDQEAQQAGVQPVTMADHQQQQQQLVKTTGETVVMGTAGTVPGEEDTVNISLNMECDPEFGQWHDSEDREHGSKCCVALSS